MHWTRLWNEILEQGKTAIPTAQGLLLYKIPWILSLWFVGKFGAEKLAAAALATTLCNVTGLSFAVGLSSALTTLTAQARGDLQARLAAKAKKENYVGGESSSASSSNSSLREDPEDPCDETTLLLLGARQQVSPSTKIPLAPLVHLYRGMIVLFLFVLPVGIWWLSGIEPTLLILGQSKELSSRTQDYLRILTPGLWAYGVSWTFTCWFQAIGMADVPAMAAALGVALHIPFNLFFMHVLGYEYLGCGMATVAFQVVQPIFMITFCFVRPAGRHRVLQSIAAMGVGRTSLSFWPEMKIALSLSGILQYLGLALPGVVLISEWWASEISIFLAGRLAPSPDIALGAMTLYQSINTFFFMFPYAVSVAGATRVGNSLGSGQSHDAAYAGRVSILCAGVVGACMACILYFTPHTFFPSLFAPTAFDLVEQTSEVIPLLALYVFADALQIAFSGIIKGCGRQAVTMPVVVIAYWLVGLPLGYYLAFVRNRGVMCHDDVFCGDVGLVTGMTTGTWVHMLLLAAVVIGTTDWKTEAARARKRLGTDSH